MPVFAHRGFTLQSIPSREYACQLIDWMSDNGLNRLEIRMTGDLSGISIPEYPELCSESAARQTAELEFLVSYGRTRNIRVVPAIAHVDSCFGIAGKRPGWRAEGEIWHPTGINLNLSNLCFQNPDVRDFYRALARSIASNVNPEEIQFWLAENNLRCECARCTGGGTSHPYELSKLHFLRQAELFYSSVASARCRDGRVPEASLWTTQGSSPYNIPLIRSLPKEVLWFYYDGERRGTYNLRKRKIFPGYLKKLIDEGYRISAQVDWYSCGFFLTSPGIVGEICCEAAETGMEGITGWIREYPVKPSAHPILTYAAAMCREPDPDPSSFSKVMEETLRNEGNSEDASAISARLWEAIGSTSRIIHLQDSYNYWWRGTNQPGAICSRIIRSAPVDEIDQRWADEMIDTTIPLLDAKLDELRQITDQSRKAEISSACLEDLAKHADIVIQWGLFCRSILRAGVIYCRMGSWDTMHGPWRNDREELLGTLRHALDMLAGTRDLMLPEKDAPEYRSFLKARYEVLRSQLSKSIEAAEKGSSPSPLPQQDSYPYASSLPQ